MPVVEPSEPPSPSSIQRPTPPVKPAKEGKEEKAEPVVLSEGVTKPSPVKKPRPQPPVKRRTSSGNKPPETTAAPAQIADSAPQPAVRPMPAPRPVPRKRVLSPQHVRESTQVIKEEVEVKEEEAKPAAVEEPVTPAAEEVKAPTTPTPTTPTPATPTPTTPTTPAPKENVKPPAKEEVIEPEKQVKQIEEKTASEETALPVDVKVVEKPVEPVIPEKPVGREAAVVKTDVEVKESKVLPDVSEDVAATGERASEKLPEKEEKKEEISEVKSTAAPEEEKGGEEVLKKVVVDVEGEKEKEKKEKVEDENTYEVMDMGDGKDDLQQPTDTKKDKEYENMTFNGTEEGAEKETKKDVIAKTAAAERPQQRVAPGKVNQYDEVAGDFLLYNPTEPAATARGAVAPGRINQYDEVAGDFLPLNYSKPKVASPSSASAQEGGPSVVAPRVPPGYEIMEPAAPALVTTKPPSLDGDYVPMKDGVMIDAEVIDEKISSEKHEYAPVGEWIDKEAKDLSPSLRPGEVSKTEYDAASKSLVSSGSHDDTHLAPETSSRQSVASSSGSTTWDVTFQFSPSDRKPRTGSGNELTVAGLDGEEGRRRGSSGASKKSGDGSELTSSQLHRDSLGVSREREGDRE